MNTTTIAPEVQEFLAAVRAHLADLDPEEQREILDGLEADLTDLVAERGRGALGDPVAYARELRAAAGLVPDMAPARERVRAGTTVSRFLDACAGGAQRVIAALPGPAEELFAWLRPVWWILRGWVAVEFIDLIGARGRYSGGLLVVPPLRGWGWVLLLAAIFISVQLGRGKVWPGRGRRGLGARVVLLALNGLALVMAPLVLLQLSTGSADRTWSDGYLKGFKDARTDLTYRTPSLALGGEAVRNIYPYDAQGHPLTGVQLVDSSGNPLRLTNDPYNEGTGWGDFVLVPWLNGKTEQFNVFPLAEQRVDSSTQEPVGVPTLQSPPFASLPPVSLAGVTPSKFVPVKP